MTCMTKHWQERQGFSRVFHSQDIISPKKKTPHWFKQIRSVICNQIDIKILILCKPDSRRHTGKTESTNFSMSESSPFPQLRTDFDLYDCRWSPSLSPSSSHNVEKVHRPGRRVGWLSRRVGWVSRRMGWVSRRVGWLSWGVGWLSRGVIAWAGGEGECVVMRVMMNVHAAARVKSRRPDSGRIMDSESSIMPFENRPGRNICLQFWWCWGGWNR